MDSNKESEDVQAFFDFFIDLIENHKERSVYYFSENALLDWFGQTVRGEKNIASFVRMTVSSVTHEFTNIKSVTGIGFRESHVVQLPIKRLIQSENIATDIPEIVGDNEKTPPNIPRLKSDLQSNKEKGQGDGFHVDQNQYHSPPKRPRMEQGDFEPNMTVKYLSASGHVEFHKKSLKKLQNETKWKRPCKLEVAYSIDPSDQYVIHLVIYQGNMKCRKNLLNDFESCCSKDKI